MAFRTVLGSDIVETRRKLDGGSGSPECCDRKPEDRGSGHRFPGALRTWSLVRSLRKASRAGVKSERCGALLPEGPLSNARFLSFGFASFVGKQLAGDPCLGASPELYPDVGWRMLSGRVRRNISGSIFPAAGGRIREGPAVGRVAAIFRGEKKKDWLVIHGPRNDFIQPACGARGRSEASAFAN